MRVLRWIGIFFLLWILGSVVSGVVEIGLALLGGSLGQYGGGFVVLLTIVIGLIIYGRRK